MARGMGHRAQGSGEERDLVEEESEREALFYLKMLLVAH